MSIGFKGGFSISQNPMSNNEIIITSITAVCVSFLQPFLGYFILRRTTKLDIYTAAAVSAHYGSVSVVTFMTAINFLETQSVHYNQYMIAVLSLMEVPAIFAALILVDYNSKKHKGSEYFISVPREALTNGAILLLTGSFLIGCITSNSGYDKMDDFLIKPFHGVLSFFLLDMGLLVSRELDKVRHFFSINLILFAIYMPIIGCIIGSICALVIGLDKGTGVLLITLCASASYIAVPAAMRLCVPQAKAAIYTPMSLAITFPMNVILGIPLYFMISDFLLK
jgi:hypothetical protein